MKKKIIFSLLVLTMVLSSFVTICAEPGTTSITHGGT